MLRPLATLLLVFAALFARPASAFTRGTASDVWDARLPADDVDTLDANVVVSLGFHGCTGTLVTPTAVLTANHCLSGAASEPGGGVGYTPTVYVGAHVRRWLGRRSFYSSIRHFGPVKPYDDDVAIVILKQPVLEEARIARPTLASPFATIPSLRATPVGSFVIGAAGWSVQGAHAARQVAYFRAISRYGIAWGYGTSGDGPGTVGRGGDSGGPLFRVRADGSRDVFGVLVGGRDSSMLVWADITRPDIATWIRDQLVDRSRSTKWLARHGRVSQWKGEVDYTGPCRRDVDRDCDHWLDAHDSCPSVPNFDQSDADDDGVGDACTPQAFTKHWI